MSLSRLPIYETAGRQLAFLKRAAIFIFPVGLLLFRMAYTGQPNNRDMAWNLLLAFIPLLLSTWLLRSKVLQRYVWLWVPLAGCWLLFLPNAPYMLTDLYHLYDHDDVPRWFDLILLLSFAWAGLVWGNISLQQMEKFWMEKFPRTRRGVFGISILFLTGLGVYMGRYWRWNSWYLVTQPLRVGKGIADLFLHPYATREAWAFTFCMAGLLWVMQPLLRNVAP
ncbi:Uncharacterized membrane protein [Chitinophaga costaii]|uniref:Uncharacterized membrane protein n=1 Tax=Chitinophaga costaii TaxID=1335309 RepID=A0A1C4DW09_9BACT|nr:DUF1361 domain-containing protein [Chitinophaga costaii]PUZ27826.1 DUF1361 domain-containing protein [Chitinophaga costaii]SCC35472.1 Uncharacterized membrane protein [Chitinophaga costaii]